MVGNTRSIPAAMGCQSFVRDGVGSLQRIPLAKPGRLLLPKGDPKRVRRVCSFSGGVNSAGILLCMFSATLAPAFLIFYLLSAQ